MVVTSASYSFRRHTRPPSRSTVRYNESWIAALEQRAALELLEIQLAVVIALLAQLAQTSLQFGVRGVLHTL